ncbi:MAG: glutamate 5-kinase [Succinivibrionaceae bacterium]|nr:glutamate 5-kinase [Succinivibrionaceae bacterium]
MTAHSKTKTIVVKLGTSILTAGTKSLSKEHILEIVRVLARLHSEGHRIVVVTSGAQAAGRDALGLTSLGKNIANRQMLAAVGQTYLIDLWAELFAIYRINIGQILLTRADLQDRERYLNARDTINALLDNKIIPVVNENDALVVAEIKVGDNDNLSARVAVLADADVLFLLTDQNGLYTADPNKDPEAKLISEVEEITDEVKNIAGDSISGLGTGGMFTKIQAAQIATMSGIEVNIVSGRHPEYINEFDSPQHHGTRFKAKSNPIERRKSWILSGQAPRGMVNIDDGAVDALVNKGSSLLPIGIKIVDGKFARGDVIKVCDMNSREIARGITHYDSDDLQRIKGVKSEDVANILGFEHGSVVIHRDDLVVVA